MGYYEDKRDKVRVKLAAKGQAATILQRQLLSGPEWDEHYSLPQEYACQILTLKIVEASESGSENTVTTRKIMMAVPPVVTPADGDHLRVDGLTYTLKSVVPFAPGGVVVYYDADLIS